MKCKMVTVVKDLEEPRFRFFGERSALYNDALTIHGNYFLKLLFKKSLPYELA